MAGSVVGQWGPSKARGNGAGRKVKEKKDNKPLLDQEQTKTIAVREVLVKKEPLTSSPE